MTTYDIPSEAGSAPSEIVDDLLKQPIDSETLSVFGRFKAFEQITRFQRLRNLWVSGLPEKKIPTVASLLNLTSFTVHNFGGKDFTELGKLSNLQRLIVFGSSRLKSLDGVERLANLKELLLVLVTGINSLQPLAALIGLTDLCVEGGFSKSLHFPTLQPLTSLQKLKRLRLASIKTDDKSLRPLHGLHALRDIFIAKTFPAEEFRLLAKALPQVSGLWLDEYR